MIWGIDMINIHNRFLNYIIILLMSFMILSPITYAASSTCPYSTKYKIAQSAKNVTAAYEINDSDPNNYSITIYIYNLKEDLSVSFTDPETNSFRTITYNDTTNDTYSFVTTNINDILTYVFTVYDVKNGCGALTSFKLVKPKYNTYSELKACKYEATKDFDYCKKWITKEIGLSEREVEKKIQEQKQLNAVTNTTTKVNDENDDQKNYELFKKIRFYAIIGLSVGIVVDIIAIIWQIVSIRRYAI